MSFTRRPVSGCALQTSLREVHHIVRTTRVEPIASSTAIQVQVAPSLRAPVSSRTIRRLKDLGDRGVHYLHTAPAAGVRVWGFIAYNTRSPLVLIRGIMTVQREDILQPHVFILMQRLPGAIFQQDNARPHTARVSQDCLHTVTTLPLSDPQICLQSSIPGILWYCEFGIPRV
ncbi:transposable element Tcb2 transposase [Trichonephila clavipes]|nr:transposable element Tcb2 transposase [Trichonephila clavipes]